jgi:hypothetical protein
MLAAHRFAWVCAVKRLQTESDPARVRVRVRESMKITDEHIGNIGGNAIQLPFN